MLRTRPEPDLLLMQHFANPSDAVADIINEWVHSANPLAFAARADGSIGVLMM